MKFTREQTMSVSSEDNSFKIRQLSNVYKSRIRPIIKDPSFTMARLLELARFRFSTGSISPLEKTHCELLIQAAEKGNLLEFERLFIADEKRLHYRDTAGRSALHHAALNDQVNILEFIFNHGGDLGMVDHEGNTALHCACAKEATKAIVFLVEKRSELLHVLNKDLNNPLHLATQLNKPKSLEALVPFRDIVDLNQRSKHGRFALHLAAIYDNVDCAKILLQKFGASPNATCENGFYPIHEAAKNASANAMKALLDFGETIGCSRADMMSFFDAEGNVPLHSAVHAGDIKAVKLCLESGALISTQQHDLSTPVHLACSQGAIDIVKVMFISQPDQKHHCLTCSDAQQMTPLHCAAMFDHVELVEYLVSEGANTSAVDKEGRSVTLLAAARGAWKTVKSLLNMSGTDLNCRDHLQRNLLHHIVVSSGSFDEFVDLIKKKVDDFVAFLNCRDAYGCTPMHYASKNGQLKTTQSLLKHGAIVNLKNNDNQSPLHIAAKYGRYNTVRHLLNSKKGHLIINEMDGDGMTPLHIASEWGHMRVVHVLLVKGALLHRCHKGRTPLHCAAKNGYTHTMEQLLAVHSHLLDQTDRDGNTALHLAAMNNCANTARHLLSLQCQISRNAQDMTAIDYALHYKHTEVAMTMVTHPTRCEEIMRCRTKLYTCLVEGLTAVMPEVMMAVLDRGITTSKNNHDSASYFIKYRFHSLQNTEVADIVPETNQPLPVMNIMVRYRREELLSHPLCVKYLETKWNSYGMYFHILNLSVYTIFLAFLTANAVQLMASHAENNRTRHAIDAGFLNRPTWDAITSLTSIIVTAFIIFNLIKECFQIYQQRAKYFLDAINILEWALYISIGLMSSSQLLPDILDRSSQCIAAALGVFLAWFNYLLFLQRFNRIGLYVVMFLEILSTLLKVMCVFSVLIIAFGLSFHILLGQTDVSIRTPMVDARTGDLGITQLNLNDKGFHSPVISLVRVGTMMLGELDFLGTYLLPMRMLETSTWYQIMAATWFLVVFIVLMPILLMNLLIGLAVGDIETVRRNAQLKRLTMQVILHTDLERKIPKRIFQYVDKNEVCEYPNQRKINKHDTLWETIKRCMAHGQGAKIHQQHDETTQQVATEPQAESAHRSTQAVAEATNTEILAELAQQRKKLRELSKYMENQQIALRQIIEKLSIEDENDEIDEGEV